MIIVFVLCVVIVIIVMKISYINDEIDTCKEKLGEMLTTDHLSVLVESKGKSIEELTNEMECVQS